MYFVTLLNYTLAGNTGRRFARSVANSSVGRKVVVFFSVNNLSQQQRAVNIDLILDFFVPWDFHFLSVCLRNGIGARESLIPRANLSLNNLAGV